MFLDGLFGCSGQPCLFAAGKCMNVTGNKTMAKSAPTVRKHAASNNDTLVIAGAEILLWIPVFLPAVLLDLTDGPLDLLRALLAALPHLGGPVFKTGVEFPGGPGRPAVYA